MSLVTNEFLKQVDLQKMIESLRGKLVESGISKGFNSESTVRISQELDYYLNLYQSTR